MQPMARRIADLYAHLNPDPVRDSLDFSPEMAAAQDRIFAPGATAEEISAALAEWLKRYQPCLFGRMSAKAGLIHYCILTEGDLTGSGHGSSAAKRAVDPGRWRLRPLRRPRGCCQGLPTAHAGSAPTPPPAESKRSKVEPTFSLIKNIGSGIFQGETFCVDRGYGRSNWPRNHAALPGRERPIPEASTRVPGRPHQRFGIDARKPAVTLDQAPVHKHRIDIATIDRVDDRVMQVRQGRHVKFVLVDEDVQDGYRERNARGHRQIVLGECLPLVLSPTGIVDETCN
jgi:hypothetical protein